MEDCDLNYPMHHHLRFPFTCWKNKPDCQIEIIYTLKWIDNSPIATPVKSDAKSKNSKLPTDCFIFSKVVNIHTNINW